MSSSTDGRSCSCGDAVVVSKNHQRRREEEHMAVIRIEIRDLPLVATARGATA